MKKIISILLCIVITLGCTTFVNATDGNIITGKLNVISCNVDGLPIPSFLSSTKRPIIKATKLLAQQIKSTDCDILCAQEDFNFHSLLEKNLGMEYSTISSGGAAIGDGLNIFSKFPIYNEGRDAWKSAYGVFDCGSDELTPKGIQYCTVEIADGVFVDVYNLHADAWEDDDSMNAKADQFDQLINLIEEHSKTDRAVILAGDFNTNYAVFREGYKGGRYNVDLCQKLLDNFIGHGFKDAWVEINNGGNYDFTYSEMRERYGKEYPRTWDTLDHIFVRDGAGVSFNIEEAYYDDFECDGITWDGYLSDHAALRTVLSYTVDTTQTKSVERNVAVENRQRHIFDAFFTLCETLLKIIFNLPSLFENGIGWIK